jgi:O-antigen/teichoic acid export membrane protein
MDKEAALDKIGVGSTVVILGLVIGAVLEYLVKMVLARFLGPESYGVFVQGFAISAATAMIALFGFHMSLPRFMSYYRGKENEEMIENSVSTSLYIVAPLSLILSVLLYLSSDWISLVVFNEPSLVTPLKLLSFAVVPLSLFYLTIAFMRGMKNARYKVILDEVLISVIELLLLSIVFIAGYGLVGAVYAYIASLFIMIAPCYYFYRKASKKSISTNSELIPRKLLNFSWPLFIISILLLTNKWSDVLMLGWLRESIEVGVYDVAFAIGSILLLLLNSLNYMFMPVVSELYGKGKLSDILEIYSTSTRWIFTLSLPIFAGILLFPSEIIKILFGNSYTTGTLPLAIIAVGFFYHAAVGPAGMILLSGGKTRTFMAATAVITAVSVLFNLVLIPVYGMLGAAIATTLGFVAGNTLYLLMVRKELNGLPYDRSYYKPVAGIAIASLVAYILKVVTEPGLIASVLLGIFLVFIYLSTLYLLGGFQEEDYELLENIIDIIL